MNFKRLLSVMVALAMMFTLMIPAAVSSEETDEVPEAAEVVDVTNDTADEPGEPEAAEDDDAEEPVDETSADETPADETPSEEAPAAEPSADETPAAEAPADETPADETPAEEDETVDTEILDDEPVTENTDSEDTEEEVPFSQGYVLVNDGTNVYASESKQEKKGSFSGDAIVYATVSTRAENEAYTWLRIVFDTVEAKEADNALLNGFVQFKDVRVLSDEAVESLLENSNGSREYQGYPLPVVNFAVAEEEAVIDEETTVNGTSSALTITEEPADFTGVIGDVAQFTVEAQNVASYQWKVSSNGGSTWGNNSTTKTLKFTLTSARMNYLVKCVLTGTDGTTQETRICKIIDGSLPLSLTITEEPADFTGVIGDVAQFTVEAQNVASYQWKVSSNGGSTWGNNSTTKTLKFTLTSARMKYLVKCVLTGTDGTTQETRICKIIDGSLPLSLTITEEPADFTGVIGDVAQFTVEAENVASYQWKLSSNGGSTWNNNSTTKTLKFTLTSARMKYLVKCILTGTDGTTQETRVCRIIDGSASTELTITEEPQDYTGTVGDTAVFTVTAENTAGYQWKYSTNGGESWINLSAKTPTLNFSLTKPVRMTYVFKCILTGVDGSTKETRVCRIIDGSVSTELTITEEPQDYTGAVGDTAVFTVTAENAAGYHWKYSTNGGEGWLNLSAQTPTLNFSLTKPVRMTYVFKCILTGVDGSTKETRVCRIINGSVSTELTITEEPQDYTGAVGDTAVFTVTAENAAGYHWKYSTNGGESWLNLSAQTPTLNFSLTKPVRMTYVFKCILTGVDGSTKETRVCRIIDGSVSTELTITEEPEDFVGEIGDIAQFTVKAENVASYQWKMSLNDGATWSNNSQTDTLKFTLTAGRMKYWVKCVLTGTDGTTKETRIAKIINPNIVVDGVTYEKVTDPTTQVISLCVKSYAGSASSLYIPETVESNGVTYTVTEIGEEAFMGNTTLTSIDLPNSITVIRARAFKNCTSLSSMTTH